MLCYFCVFLPLPVCCHHSWELQRWQLSHDVSLLASGDNDGLDLETQRRNKTRTSVREALMLHVLRSLLVVLVTSSTDNTGALIRACLVLFFFDVCMQRTRSCTLTHACFFDRIEFFSMFDLFSETVGDAAVARLGGLWHHSRVEIQMRPFETR